MYWTVFSRQNLYLQRGWRYKQTRVWGNNQTSKEFGAFYRTSVLDFKKSMWLKKEKKRSYLNKKRLKWYNNQMQHMELDWMRRVFLKVFLQRYFWDNLGKLNIDWVLDDIIEYADFLRYDSGVVDVQEMSLFLGNFYWTF